MSFLFLDKNKPTLTNLEACVWKEEVPTVLAGPDFSSKWDFSRESKATDFDYFLA